VTTLKAPRLAHVTAGHLADLAKFGLTPDTIHAAGIYSASAAEASALVGYGIGPAMVIPYEWNGDGRPAYARVKLDVSDDPKRRYRAPRARGNRLYIPPTIDAFALVDTKAAIYITEGEKKTLRAVQDGLNCIGVSGVWNWKTRNGAGPDVESVPIADLEALPWQDRPVRIVFDSDAASNPNVLKAEYELATELSKRGAHVSIIRLPAGPDGAKQGLDDFLVAHGVEAFQALPRSPVVLQTTPTPPPLTLMGAGDFLALDYGQPEAFIEGILSDDGGGWLGGEEKTNKTWWAIEESASLALGLPVCGRFAVPQRRRVLVLEEEDSPRRTQRRFRAILRGKAIDPDDPAVRADLNAWLRISVWSGFTLDNPALVEQLRAAIAAFAPAVVYIDCLRKVTIRNLNHADEASALLNVLDLLRREYGVIFRLIHHYRKTQGFRAGRGSQEIGGSFVLGAWGENSLFFEPIGRKQGAVRVEVQSKDGAPAAGFRLTLEAEGPAHAPTLIRLIAEETRPALRPTSSSSKPSRPCRSMRPSRAPPACRSRPSPRPSRRPSRPSAGRSTTS
jgi:hypothetical protein